VYHALVGNNARMIKVVQGWQTLIYDFDFVMKLVEVDVFNMYYGVKTRFFPPHHLFFLKLVDHYNDALFLVWWTKLVFQVQYVAFKFGPNIYIYIPLDRSSHWCYRHGDQRGLGKGCRICQNIMCFNYYRFDNKIGEAISHT
jgi:hypothetical protein